jgi:hypothetical protein
VVSAEGGSTALLNVMLRVRSIPVRTESGPRPLEGGASG